MISSARSLVNSRRLRRVLKTSPRSRLPNGADFLVDINLSYLKAFLFTWNSDPDPSAGTQSRSRFSDRTRSEMTEPVITVVAAAQPVYNYPEEPKYVRHVICFEHVMFMVRRHSNPRHRMYLRSLSLQPSALRPRLQLLNLFLTFLDRARTLFALQQEKSGRITLSTVTGRTSAR